MRGFAVLYAQFSRLAANPYVRFHDGYRGPSGRAAGVARGQVVALCNISNCSLLRPVGVAALFGRSTMRIRVSLLLVRSLIGAASVAMLSAAALADGGCSGHQLLPTPRSPSSCQTVAPQVYASPDAALRALVFPVDASLHATPDMESRVVMQTSAGQVLAAKDYSSPSGADGYYVVAAKWSPDSQFFVYSMSSSGGHSPWSFPMWVYGRHKNLIAAFNAMIGNNPTVSADFTFVGPHTISATTWQKPGSTNTVTITVDLEDAINKIAVAPQ
jgi:hypothetical protein